MRRPRFPHRARWFLVALLLIVSSSGPVRAQDLLEGILDFFQPARRAARPQAERDIPDEMLNQFLPTLSKVLTAEIHFVRKVCRPDDEQLAAIREAGEEELKSIARTYASMMRNNRHTGFPDGHERVCRVLREKVEALMPEEAAQRYGDELAARAAAEKEATVGMMTVVIDRLVCLSPEQFDQASEAIGKNWDEQWSGNLQVFTYEQYAPIPPPGVLQKFLDSRQQELLRGRPNHSTIHFGWEQEMRVLGMNDLALEELDEYPAAEGQ